MNQARALWAHANENRKRWLGTSAGIIMFGVLLIAVGEVLDWGWTRLVGAGLISVAAVVFGVLVGWSDPVRPRIADTLRRQRKAIVIALTLIMVVPLFIALVIGFGGLFGADASADTALAIVGLLITLGLLGITAATVVHAVRLALHGVDRIGPDGNGRSEPDGAQANGGSER